jgi:translation initiation factor IF-2
LGRALVKQTFTISRVGTVAGCYVAAGNIERNCRMRVHRDGRTIGDYAIETLRREKDDVREVQRGMECGIKLAGFNDVKKDDILEAYKIEEFARTL